MRCIETGRKAAACKVRQVTIRQVLSGCAAGRARGRPAPARRYRRCANIRGNRAGSPHRSGRRRSRRDCPRLRLRHSIGWPARPYSSAWYSAFERHLPIALVERAVRSRRRSARPPAHRSRRLRPAPSPIRTGCRRPPPATAPEHRSRPLSFAVQPARSIAPAAPASIALRIQIPLPSGTAAVALDAERRISFHSGMAEMRSPFNRPARAASGARRARRAPTCRASGCRHRCARAPRRWRGRGPSPASISSSRRAARQRRLAVLRRQPRPVILEADGEEGAPAAVLATGRDAHLRCRPLAGIVEEIAGHLLQILLLAAEAQLRRDRRVRCRAGAPGAPCASRAASAGDAPARPASPRR